MSRIRERRVRRSEATDLDVTPFMNLMIVLVPVLLLSMVFTHTRIIDLDFPATGSASDANDPELVHLEVVVRADSLVVADGRGGVIRALPGIDGRHDYAELSLVMQELKRRLPEKRDIALLLEDDVDYQTLVSVMDSVRTYRARQDDEVVNAELFPIITLGDAPARDGRDVAVHPAASGARS